MVAPVDFPRSSVEGEGTKLLRGGRGGGFEVVRNLVRVFAQVEELEPLVLGQMGEGIVPEGVGGGGRVLGVVFLNQLIVLLPNRETPLPLRVRIVRVNGGAGRASVIVVDATGRFFPVDEAAYDKVNTVVVLFWLINHLNLSNLHNHVHVARFFEELLSQPLDRRHHFRAEEGENFSQVMRGIYRRV